jgi:hypothetical protein
MTATVTALIELAVEHGWGIALLIIGAQVVLDRLMPVEHVVGFLFGGFRRSTPAREGRGAHRLERNTRPSAANTFGPAHRGALKPIRCTE